MQSLKTNSGFSVVKVRQGKYLSDIQDNNVSFVTVEKDTPGLVLEELKDKSSQDKLTRLRVLVNNKLVIVWVNNKYECV